MARNKLNSDVSGSDTETDAGKRRRKHRKKEILRGAPYIEKYYEKKELEATLDDMDFWHEKENALKTHEGVSFQQENCFGYLTFSFCYWEFGIVWNDYV